MSSGNRSNSLCERSNSETELFTPNSTPEIDESSTLSKGFGVTFGKTLYSQTLYNRCVKNENDITALASKLTDTTDEINDRINSTDETVTTLQLRINRLERNAIILSGKTILYYIMMTIIVVTISTFIMIGINEVIKDGVINDGISATSSNANRYTDHILFSLDDLI